MIRKTSLTALCICLVLLAGIQPASAKLALKIATIAPEGTALTKALREASKEIKKATGGRVYLKLYPGGVMGSAPVVLRKMRVGQLHGSTFTSGELSSVYQPYQTLSQPLMIRNHQEAAAAKAKLGPKLTQGLKDKGLISFGLIEAGFVYIMSNKPLTKLEDLRGSKPWVPEGDQVGRALFEAIGVTPIPVALPDVMISLQTGLIDTVANSPVGALALQWFTKVKYLTHNPLLYAYGSLALSKRAWQKMSPDDRGQVDRILRATMQKLDQIARQDNDKGLATLRKQGLKFVELQPGQMQALQDLMGGIIKKSIAAGELDADLVAEAQAAIKAVRQRD